MKFIPNNRPNRSFQLTAQKLRFWIPSALRAPAAPHFHVEAVEKLVFDADAKLTMKSTLQNGSESSITASGRGNGPRYLHRVMEIRVFLHPR